MPTVEAWKDAHRSDRPDHLANEHEDLRQFGSLWWNAYRSAIKLMFRDHLLSSGGIK
jgi:hypothetical protein